MPNEKIETHEGFFKFAESISSNLIVQYHNHMRRLLQNEITWVNKKMDTGGTEKYPLSKLRNAKDLYAGQFQDYLRSNVFLMLYSHLEEWLWHFRRSFAPSVELGRGSSIGRFSPVLAKGANLDLGLCSQWNYLVDCSYIRDCLLHANGRVSLSKKSQKIIQIANSKNHGVTILSDRIRIEGGLVRDLFTTIDELLNMVLGRVST